MWNLVVLVLDHCLSFYFLVYAEDFNAGVLI